MLLEKNSSFLRNEANPVSFYERDEKKVIEKNFFDQQIQVSWKKIQKNYEIYWGFIKAMWLILGATSRYAKCNDRLPFNPWYIRIFIILD